MRIEENKILIKKPTKIEVLMTLMIIASFLLGRIT